MNYLRRATIVATLGALASSLRGGARASDRVFRLGVMINTNENGSSGIRRAIEEELARHKLEVGLNLKIQYYYSGETADNASGTPELIRRAAKDLVAMRPDAIYVDTTERAVAVKAETATIPIVFSVGADPVASGLVRSLSHPGENATGSNRFTAETIGKRIELARELLPKARRLAIVADHSSIRIAGFPERFKAQAAALGFENIRADTSQYGNDLLATLKDMSSKPDALITIFPFFGPRQEPFKIMEEYERAARVPVIYEFPGNGIIALGADWGDSVRVALEIVARVLRGARPADMPVHQATRILLTVNLAKARAIGLEIPHSIVVRADRIASS